MTASLRHFILYGIFLCAGLAAVAQVAQVKVQAPFAKRDIEIPNEGEARLIAPAGEGWVWSNGWKTPVIFVREAGWYWVDVMQGDTLVRDSIHCNVKPACFLISPVFYPNREISNGCYDFQIACEMESFRIKILNRWGSLMYESRDPKACWDAKFKGEDLPEGMYTCIVEWIAVGEPLRKKSSFITILR